MNEEERMEEELRRMVPAALSGELMGRVAGVLEERMTLGDRVLAVWTGMGALAACVIVGVGVWQLALAPRAGAATGQETAARQDFAAEVERLMASR